MNVDPQKPNAGAALLSHQQESPSPHPHHDPLLTYYLQTSPFQQNEGHFGWSVGTSIQLQWPSGGSSGTSRSSTDDLLALSPISAITQEFAHQAIDNVNTDAWHSPIHKEPFYDAQALWAQPNHLPQSQFLPQIAVHRPCWSEMSPTSRNSGNSLDDDVDFAALLNDDMFDDEDGSEDSFRSNSASDGPSMPANQQHAQRESSPPGSFIVVQEEQPAAEEEAEVSPKRRRISKLGSTSFREKHPRARRKPTKPDPEERESLESSSSPQSRNESSPKNKHTLVERKYRRSLNDRFNELLQVLPTDGEAGQIDAEAKRSMKKGQILEMAKAYITQLEEKHESVEQERFNLERKVEIYQEALRGLGAEEEN